MIAILNNNGHCTDFFTCLIAGVIVKKIRIKLDHVGLGGILLSGRPGRPLLDIPVSEGMVGMMWPEA